MGHRHNKSIGIYIWDIPKTNRHVWAHLFIVGVCKIQYRFVVPIRQGLVWHNFFKAVLDSRYSNPAGTILYCVT